MTLGVLGQLHVLFHLLRFCLFMLSPTSERLWGGLEVVWCVSIDPKITVGANRKPGIFLPQGLGWHVHSVLIHSLPSVALP